MTKNNCLLVFILLILSCGSDKPEPLNLHTKKEYISAYTDFVVRIEKTWRHRSDKEWAKADKSFDDFHRTYYMQFAEELSYTENKRLDKLENRYKLCKAKAMVYDLPNKAMEFFRDKKKSLLNNQQHSSTQMKLTSILQHKKMLHYTLYAMSAALYVTALCLPLAKSTTTTLIFFEHTEDIFWLDTIDWFWTQGEYLLCMFIATTLLILPTVSYMLYWFPDRLCRTGIQKWQLLDVFVVAIAVFILGSGNTVAIFIKSGYWLMVGSIVARMILFHFYIL